MEHDDKYDIKWCLEAYFGASKNGASMKHARMRTVVVILNDQVEQFLS